MSKSQLCGQLPVTFIDTVFKEHLADVSQSDRHKVLGMYSIIDYYSLFIQLRYTDFREYSPVISQQILEDIYLL